MKEIVARRVKDLTINTDSELLVKQLGGEYKVKSPNLKKLFKEVQGLLLNFDEVVINHIKREKNKLADELANKAIDTANNSKKKSDNSFVLKTKKNSNSLF